MTANQAFVAATLELLADHISRSEYDHDDDRDSALRAVISALKETAHEIREA